MRDIKTRSQRTEAASMLSKKSRTKTRFASRGKRYTPAIKEEILAKAESQSLEDASEAYGVSESTILRWNREESRRKPSSVRKKEPGSVSLLPQEDRRNKILEVWKEHPGYGPSQVRNTLRRTHNLKAPVTTVRDVMEESGYVGPRPKKREPRRRYEAGRPRELYHLDFCHFFVHKQKQCLLFIQDDFSRFIVGWCLVPAEAADPVIKCFEGAVERYGKPEAVMSDRGSAFHSWRGISRFQKLLEEMEVNFVLATEPQTNGKIEALNAAVQKECLTHTKMTDLTNAARVIGSWVEGFNHVRTHHGLGGLLVPADRFYGIADRTLKMIGEGQGGHALDILNPDHRGLELFRVVSHGGNPEVYLMGKKILG